MNMFDLYLSEGVKKLTKGKQTSPTTKPSLADRDKNLNEGDTAEFEVERGPKGLQATKVSVL